MIDYQTIIQKYYPTNNRLRHILLEHSRSVTQKALRITQLHPELKANETFIEEAAMLHDIGIYLCNAPGIECFGNEPYICHGILGANLMRHEGLPEHARVCERHTGAGLTRTSIIEQNLPLPHHNFLPETIEEKIMPISSSPKLISTTRKPSTKPNKVSRNSVPKNLLASKPGTPSSPKKPCKTQGNNTTGQPPDTFCRYRAFYLSLRAI